MRRLIFFMAMLASAQAHAGLFVFSGADAAPFKVSFDGLQSIDRSGTTVARLSLRIEDVSRPVKSATIRCEGSGSSGGAWSFSQEVSDLSVGEVRTITLDGAVVAASSETQPTTVRCDVVHPLPAG
ncbi:UNVERIFIED_ORG: hypothetical protein LHK14_24820 (plasmid) [Roseateles sp. XES5]|nr:hypothetical protein [Roseateles sp. XES5]